MKLLIGTIIAALAGTPLIADAQGMFQCGTILSGGQVVPPTGSHGVAQLYGQFATCAGCYDCESGAAADSLAITMTYHGLSGPPTGAAVYVGQPGSNGDLLYVIASQTFQSSDTLFVRIAAADCESLQLTGCYVTIATATFPNGEVRGQLACGVSPAIPASWGRLRTLFR